MSLLCADLSMIISIAPNLTSVQVPHKILPKIINALASFLIYAKRTILLKNLKI